MKKVFIILSIILSSFTSKATIHVVNVWDGYFRFVDAINFSPDITIQLGDTVQWLPLDVPMMVHTITSTNIPVGAATFDQIWQAPADTFFQYVPQIAGLYEYECTPHATSHDMVGSINVIAGTTNISSNGLTGHDLQVYPNPAMNFIELTETNTASDFIIYNINGKIALSGIIDGRINISTLLIGTYFIEIIGDKPRIMKFIKQ
tara:strand:- start:54 stop:665 length:612 start_codon:yes stop_codon:yes gene_type:complete